MTIKKTISHSMVGNICCLCLEQVGEKEVWCIPKCNEKHMMHWVCAEGLRARALETNQPLLCPQCRCVIKWDEVQKTELEAKKPGTISKEEAFGVDDV